MTTTRARQYREQADQIALFQWATIRASARPELSLLFAVPNFARVKSARDGARRKAEGMKPGVPDMFLAVPRGGFHGLFVELKSQAGRNRVSTEQRWWLAQLQEQGYRAEVCHGFEEARRVIERYLDGRG